MATHLPSLKDSVLLLVLRHLARNELLRLRIASQELCSRLSTMMSDEQMARAICFERRLRMPASLDGVPDLTVLEHGGISHAPPPPLPNRSEHLGVEI